MSRAPIPNRAGPGNDRARKHGLYSVVTHSEQVGQVAEELRDAMPVYRPAYEGLILSTALLVCQLTAEPDPPELGSRRSQDYRGRQAELRRHLAELGMTPMAMARLGLDLARSEALVEERLKAVEGAAARAEKRFDR